MVMQLTIKVALKLTDGIKWRIMHLFKSNLQIKKTIIASILLCIAKYCFAQSSVSKALQFYCEKRNVDSFNCNFDSILVVKLSDTKDSTVPFIDSFCSIIQDGAAILGEEIYAIEVKKSSTSYTVEFVWYSRTRDKLYLVTDTRELEAWIDDGLILSKNWVLKDKRSQYLRNRTAYKYMSAQLYLSIMSYNCYYKQNLEIPSRVVRNRKRLRRYLTKHPLEFTLDRY